MAITKTRGGWLSTLTKTEYDTKQSAEHFEKLERLKMAANVQEEGEKILNSLTTEQLKSLVQTMNFQADMVYGREKNNEETLTWAAANPGIVREGTQEGYRNLVACSVWLNERGKKAPFSESELNSAAAALTQSGVLEIDRKLQPEEVEPEYEFDSSSDPLGPNPLTQFRFGQ